MKKLFISFACLILTLTDVQSRSVKGGVHLKPSFSPLSAEMINFINQADSTWKAAPTKRFQSIKDVKRSLGAIKSKDRFTLPKKPILLSEPMAIELPESFDSRQKWSSCKYISEVRDQSNCGSCWAFGAVAAITDRYCIHSNGAQQPRISAEDLLSCCGYKCGHGCHGGNPARAWEYWVNEGIVTGGEYQGHLGCQDYAFPKCSHHVKSIYPSCTGINPTPKCKRECQAGYPFTYFQDKQYGASAYSLENNEQEIMKEIMINGPVEVSIYVYEDFPNYKSGVYQHIAGDFVGGHAMKMIGWGVENGTPYWLIVNSWNPTWGEDGVIKFLRGSNECDIEEGIVAGLPKL